MQTVNDDNGSSVSHKDIHRTVTLTDESFVAKPDMKAKQFLLVPISPREVLRRCSGLV